MICDAATTTILAAVELDDSSHQRGSRIARDQFVDSVLDTTGIPLLRFKVQHTYNIETVRAALGSLAAQPSKSAPPPNPDERYMPTGARPASFSRA